jgi:hypothetical protein
MRVMGENDAEICGACKSSTGLDSKDRRGLQRPALGLRTVLSTDAVDNVTRKERHGNQPCG